MDIEQVFTNIFLTKLAKAHVARIVKGIIQNTKKI